MAWPILRVSEGRFPAHRLAGGRGWGRSGIGREPRPGRFTERIADNRFAKVGKDGLRPHRVVGPLWGGREPQPKPDVLRKGSPEVGSTRLWTSSAIKSERGGDRLRSDWNAGVARVALDTTTLAMRRVPDPRLYRRVESVSNQIFRSNAHKRGSSPNHLASSTHCAHRWRKGQTMTISRGALAHS